MATLRMAVVGVGAYETSRARGYLATIQKLADLYTLCALCDHSEGSLQAAGERFGVAARYTDVEKMLEAEKPDVVFVLVPTDGQTVIALTAARHQYHIITEIPYALTLALGDAIAQTCRENGVKWEIAENVWRWPHERLKRKIVEAGRSVAKTPIYRRVLGPITHARLWYASGSYHGFNAVRMILGSEPQRALGYAQAVDVPPYMNYGGQQETARWWESGIIEFAPARTPELVRDVSRTSSGVHECVTCLYEMPPSPGARGSHWEVEGTGGYLTGSELVLYREGGAMRYPFKEVHKEIDGEKILTAVRVDTDPPIVWENPFAPYKISHADDVAKASILHSLHRAVMEGVEPEYGAANARRDMELWIALRESAGRGNVWLDLPLTETTELERRIHAEYVRRYG
ncbi:Gfo/Idh/MocA family oxidoreductase, partial [Candidatus Poribacteria bacterium]|nr:Gfo/Idh/MocA family oxidoreductase [Candidatus Poribacteria bacterium]